MGKRNKSCSSVKESKKEAKVHKYEPSNENFESKSQLFEEPQNEARSSKNKKIRLTQITHENKPVKHKLSLEENIEVEEVETVQLSTPVKKVKANKKKKTRINEETNESKSEKNAVAVETENLEVEDAELSPHTRKVKTNKKTRTRTKQNDEESNVVAVESENGDLLGDLSNNKVKIKKKNNGKIGKVTKTVGTDNEAVEIDNQIVKPRKLKNTQLSQEDDVKDEDIDMFCEELSEEDNVQYNNWVELIEAKLSGNKKKPK